MVRRAGTNLMEWRTQHRWRRQAKPGLVWRRDLQAEHLSVAAFWHAVQRTNTNTLAGPDLHAKHTGSARAADQAVTGRRSQVNSWQNTNPSRARPAISATGLLEVP